MTTKAEQLAQEYGEASDRASAADKQRKFAAGHLRGFAHPGTLHIDDCKLSRSDALRLARWILDMYDDEPEPLVWTNEAARFDNAATCRDCIGVAGHPYVVCGRNGKAYGRVASRALFEGTVDECKAFVERKIRNDNRAD